MAVNFTDKNPSYISCDALDLNFKIVHTTALKTSYLWACILNGILATHTTILNSLIIVLYFKDRHFQTTANVLILALAWSDLFVALLTQPAAIVNNALKFYGIHSCVSELTTFTLTQIGVGLSYFTVCFTLTCERLLAICWPLKHHVLVTKSLLKKIFLVQAVCCAFVSPLALNAPLKLLLAFQSGFIIVATVFMLAVYLCIFITIHKRSRTVGKNCETSRYLEKEAQNCKRKKISGGNVSHDSKGENKSPEIVSQDSKQVNETTGRVSQHSDRADISTDIMPQDSTRENKSANHVSQDSKGKRNTPNNVSQNSNLLDKSPNSVSHDSKCEGNLDEKLSENSKRDWLDIVSHDSKRNSLNIVSHDLNGKDMKTSHDKLKDELCPFKACSVLLQKAMLKLKQESRVCKTMAMIAAALVLCFVPRVVIFQCAVTGVISMQTLYDSLTPWLDVLGYANSSLNPYIYFFNNKDIAEGVKKILFGKNSGQLNNARLTSGSSQANAKI